MNQLKSAEGYEFFFVLFFLDEEGGKFAGVFDNE